MVHGPRRNQVEVYISYQMHGYGEGRGWEDPGAGHGTRTRTQILQGLQGALYVPHECDGFWLVINTRLFALSPPCCPTTSKTCRLIPPKPVRDTHPASKQAHTSSIGRNPATAFPGSFPRIRPTRARGLPLAGPGELRVSLDNI
jgi:hypothetical protein